MTLETAFSFPGIGCDEKTMTSPGMILTFLWILAAILDRFFTLTTDLTQGLPAEIEKRRQQYEFYRDKLLTFKRKEA